MIFEAIDNEEVPMNAFNDAPVTFPSHAAMPSPSAALVAEMQRLGDPHGNVRELLIAGDLVTFSDRLPPSAARDEAASLVAQIDVMLEPVSRETIRAWLQPFADAARGTWAPWGFSEWADSVALACAATPRCAYTIASQSDALLRLPFRPAAANIFSLVMDYAQPVIDRRYAVNRVATVRPLSELSGARERGWRERDPWDVIEAAGRQR